MLIVFIHGVATRDVKYANPLKAAIREKLLRQGKTAPTFYSCFWGNALGDVEKMWNWIDQDLRSLQQQDSSVEAKDCFRYRPVREGLLSEFVGDMFIYLHQQRGFEIRAMIAQQFRKFLEDNPHEQELHIICHSLGTVIFWDMLFSERFTENDPAFEVRSLIQNLGDPPNPNPVTLKSITTMGSPILFFNTMLAVDPKTVKAFADRSSDSPLRWLNLIHSSDLIAYPLTASFQLEPQDKLHIRDVYLDTNSNLAARAARSLGQDMAAIALDAGPSHGEYWNCARTAELIADHLQQDPVDRPIEGNHLQKAIEFLQTVPGMTIDKLKLHINDKPAEALNFADGSGKIFHIINAAKVHHVCIFDNMNLCRFSGYVGWLDTHHLQDAVELTKKFWC
jgi:hypothetical protein